MKKEMSKLVYLDRHGLNKYRDRDYDCYVRMTLNTDPEYGETAHPYIIALGNDLHAFISPSSYQSPNIDRYCHIWSRIIRYWIEEVYPDLLPELSIRNSERSLKITYGDGYSAESFRGMYQLENAINDLLWSPKDIYSIVIEHQDKFVSSNYHHLDWKYANCVNKLLYHKKFCNSHITERKFYFFIELQLYRKSRYTTSFTNSYVLSLDKELMLSTPFMSDRSVGREYSWALIIRYWIEEKAPELLSKVSMYPYFDSLMICYGDRRYLEKNAKGMQQLEAIISDLLWSPKDIFRIVSEHADAFSLHYPAYLQQKEEDPCWYNKEDPDWCNALSEHIHDMMYAKRPTGWEIDDRFDTEW